MRKRILIVEDVRNVRENLCGILELQDFEVKVAAAAEEAIALVDRVTFHVASIDIALDESDNTNTDGLKVLAELSRLDEGTRALIASANKEQDLTIEAYERYGLARYLKKGQFSIEEFAAAVAKEASAAKLRVFGEFAHIFDALLFKLEPVWADSALSAVHVKGGVHTLRTGVEAAVSHLAPIRPHRDAGERARIDRQNGTITFRFWSKARGLPFRCVIGSPSTVSVAEGEERHAFGGVEAVITEDSSGERASYFE